MLSVLSCPNTHTAPRSHSHTQKYTEGQVLSRGTDQHATQSLVPPFGKYISWHIPFASSLGSAGEEEEEEGEVEEPAQPDGARPAARATAAPAERLLPADGVQPGTWRAMGNTKLLKMVSASLVGTNSLKCRPSVCCFVLGHVLQLLLEELKICYITLHPLTLANTPSRTHICWQDTSAFI